MFNSEIFIFLFLPIVFIINYLLPKNIRKYFLLLSSFIFYIYNDLQYFLVLIGSILFNYLILSAMNRFKAKKDKKLFLIFGITYNIIILCYFKYLSFLVYGIEKIFDLRLVLKTYILPIGISFYIFQIISYLIDVYNDKISFDKNIINYALYVSFFPKLVSGPIVRYEDFKKGLVQEKIDISNITIGIKRFIIGLAKKVILANTLSLMVNNIWNVPTTSLNTFIAWLGALGYTLEIYFDFSGYSDMAIGIAQMLGYNFKENFNYPYMANSLTDFWRRWHISLSTFFRDYVYIPLGGNKKHQLFNILIVFILTGIWHGAGITFLIWGLWHALFNILEKIFKINKLKDKNIFIKVFSHLYTLFIVLIGWIIFKAPDLESMLIYLKAMFINNNNYSYSIWWFLTKYNILIIILGLIFSTDIPKKIYSNIRKNNLFYILENIFLIIIFIISIFKLLTSNYSPFIYFQF